MTDPQAFVADQIGQQAEIRDATPGQAVQVPAAGLGVTSVDLEALAAQISAMQTRLAGLEADKAPSGDALAGTAATIQHFLTIHGDPQAAQLGDDLAEAVKAAGESGDTSAVAQIAARLDRHLAKNPPAPGENYGYRNAAAFVGDVPDLLADFRAVPSSGQVISGSVVG